MVAPRVLSLPPSTVSSLGVEAVELAASAGLVLDPWQAYVLEKALGQNAAGRWSAFEVGLNVARQNGKGAILEARILAGLFLTGEKWLIYSAHLQDTSMEMMNRLVSLIEESDLSGQLPARGGVRRANGQEAIRLRNGAGVRFRTRTSGGGRGFTADCTIFDEAMFLPVSAHAAIIPALAGRSKEGNPQVWYAGSAVDQMVHEHGVVWSLVRERGLKGGDPSLAYFEWSAPLDNPDELDESQLMDDANLLAANPALDIRISREYVANEFRALDLRSFAVERDGVGDYFSSDRREDTPLPYDDWMRLEQKSSVVLDPVCVSFDVSPDRRASIAVAGRNQDGLWHVEVIRNRQGTSWLAGEVSGLVERHDVQVVVCDGYGPAGSMIRDIEDAGVKVEPMSATEHGQACGRLVDQVAQDGLRHLGSGELGSAVRGAKPRSLGDAWAWSRKNSTVDISPLVAVTLALSAAIDNQDSGGGNVW